MSNTDQPKPDDLIEDLEPSDEQAASLQGGYTKTDRVRDSRTRVDTRAHPDRRPTQPTTKR